MAAFDLIRVLTALELALPYLDNPCSARYAAEDAVADLRHALGLPPLPLDNNAPEAAPGARHVA
jgi:hypothetical protein